MSLGHNGGYILASYVIAAVLMGTFVWYSARRYAAAKRKLAKTSDASDG
jgi:heme exporter protein CcmD